MLEDFKNYIHQKNLFEPDHKVLLAVSGGIDSVVMCHLFHSASCNFAIAHCNFGLRGLESDGDEDLVRQISINYGVPFYNTKFDTITYARENKLTIQVAARNLRIGWLEQVVSSGGFTCYATAHHQDDNIETFFLNLIRGTGIKGLRGIQPKNGLLIHPLLFSGRKQIEDYALKHELTFREDSSNKQNYYRRNKLRNIIIPELLIIQPDFKKIMIRNINKLNQVERIYTEKIRDLKKQYTRNDNNSILIDHKSILTTESAKLYLVAILEEYGFNESICLKIIESGKKQSGRKFFSEKYILTIERDFLQITEQNLLEPEKEVFTIQENDPVIYNPIKMTTSTLNRDEISSLITDKNRVFFDKQRLRFPLTLRRWKNGDYFYPFGLGGRKKLSDFFIDQKFSDRQKQQTWLLCSGNNIIWIVGQRSDERYKITPSTKIVYSLIMVNTE